MHEWGGLTRFASSSIHQSTHREDTGIRVRVVSEGRIGVAASNDFSLEGARRAALYRARERFSKHLESMLMTALDVHRRERCLLEAALRIVRGKAIAKAMAASSSTSKS